MGSPYKWPKINGNKWGNWDYFTPISGVVITLVLGGSSQWLGLPPFISHEVRPFGRGSTTRSLNRSPWLSTTHPNWDDPPSRGPGSRQVQTVPYILLRIRKNSITFQ